MHSQVKDTLHVPLNGALVPSAVTSPFLLSMTGTLGKCRRRLACVGCRPPTLCGFMHKVAHTYALCLPVAAVLQINPLGCHHCSGHVYHKRTARLRIKLSVYRLHDRVAFKHFSE